MKALTTNPFRLWLGKLVLHGAARAAYRAAQLLGGDLTLMVVSTSWVEHQTERARRLGVIQGVQMTATTSARAPVRPAPTVGEA